VLETFSQFIRRIVRALNRGGLDYVFTGALASSYYGRARTTLDADVVLAIQEKQLQLLGRRLTEAGLNVQKDKLKAAWKSTYRIITIEDRKTPHTLDIIFTNDKLKKNRGRMLGLATYFEAPDSLILAKLRMIKVTVDPARASNDREDIKAILENTPVDLKSLKKRAAQQGTAEILADLLTHSKF
jgi:hypothetical protein